MANYNCEFCKHWTPTLGRESTDQRSTWGSCDKLLSMNVGTTGPWVGLRAEPDVNADQPKTLTPKSFGCNGWTIHRERWRESCDATDRERAKNPPSMADRLRYAREE